ncbi:F-box/LRR-repeat protein at3g59200 [Phtheirospermum japonicum]|uniref:F-box/LRR-repeat protein at3g59200 n=1 Tax=Phtheirospermum japonicum TaxID=374723 RepID=A0A830DFS6_9LAMI|nr:F-box/LRR-repeat protein at3g59200 [Phtheirospermum japonicum]
MPSSIDRLSAFPDDILCHILSFLPTKTSISTSILAQRWRFLWAHVPNLNLGRGKAPKIDTIYNKVMLPYRVKKMNTFRLFSDDAKCCRSQLTSCIQDAINRNVAVLNLSLVIAYTFPSCIFNCKTLVNLKLAGHGDITLMSINDDVYLPSLKKLFLYSVGYVCEETLPYLLSRCPVLEELTVHKLEADVACFVVSSRTIKRLVLNSYFVIRYYTNNRYTVKIDAPELTYLKFHDYESKDVSCGSLTSLIEADVQLDADADDDDADDDVFDGDAPVEDDVNDVSDDDAHDNDISDDDVLNNEAPIEGDVLYARSVLEFVGGLFNVKYLKLSARWMNVSV